MSAPHPFVPVPLHAGNPGVMTGEGNWTYLIAGRGVATLVDAGVARPSHLAAIAEALQKAGATLQSIVVTHGHSDHAGGAAALVAAHPGAVCAKYPWPGADARFPVPWTLLSDGQTIDAGDTTLQVIHTPGHSPDHIALWHAESRTLFTGDLVIPEGSVVIQTSRGGDMAAYIGSLERLLKLEAKRILPAHGGPRDNALAVLRTAIAHRLQREQQVLDALGSGLSTVPDITKSIYHGLSAALMPAAEENVRAHLDKLRREGRTQ